MTASAQLSPKRELVPKYRMNMSRHVPFRTESKNNIKYFQIQDPLSQLNPIVLLTVSIIPYSGFAASKMHTLTANFLTCMSLLDRR